jgi:uncharacterized protein (TIGR02147 family)
MNASKESPNIFEYGNYREFLRDLYEHEKATHPKFSFRFFSKQAGFSSPNFLKLVIEGKRNLSAESIVRFAKALKLTQPQAAFFRSLVLFNQAATTEERGLWAQEILKSKVYRKLHPLHAAEYAYYSRWYNVAVRELMGLPSFREDPDWIARAFSPAIGVNEAREAIESLVELGLVRREGGKLERTEAILTTGDEVSSSAVAQFHREMLAKAADSIDRVAAPERDISALTVSVSAARAKEIKALLQRVRKEILAIADGDPAPDRVVQVCMQLFPLTDSEKTK